MSKTGLVKQCSKCSIEKPLTDFNKQAKSRDGHHYYCRACQRDYVQANRARYTENSNRWARENAEAVAARLARWRAENAEHIAEYKRVYRAENRESLLEYDSRYYLENIGARREHGRNSNRAWRATSPDKRRTKDARRRAVLREAFVEDVSLDLVLARDGNRCIVCSSEIDTSVKHPDPLSASLEHIVPLSRGGLHSYGNCAASHLACNLAKGVKLLEEVAAEKP